MVLEYNNVRKTPAGELRTRADRAAALAPFWSVFFGFLRMGTYYISSQNRIDTLPNKTISLK